MLGKPTITDKLLSFLADLDDAINYPKSFGQLINWDKHQYYKHINRLKAQQKRERKRIKNALWNLEKVEVVTYNQQSGGYKLTFKGWLKYMYLYNKRNKDNRKDKLKKSLKGQYLVVFDIPKDYDRFRDLFRECLKNMSFHMVQKSVWQTSDKNDFIYTQKIVSNCELDGHVKFIKVDRMF